MDKNGKLVLKTILEIQGNSNNYVSDVEIESKVPMNIDIIRGYIGYLEDYGLIKTANTHDGYRAHLLPKHKIMAQELLDTPTTNNHNTQIVPGWINIKHLGEGGQGKVYLVEIANELRNSDLQNKLTKSIIDMTDLSHGNNEAREQSFTNFKQSVLSILDTQDPSRLGALKILHELEDARDYDSALHRIKNEITAMNEFSHPNLLKIIDVDQDYKWYVSEYHPNKTLDVHLKQFRGDALRTLYAIKPLIEAVGHMHEKGFVHRDIKPQNIFLGEDGQLVLGDFGLIFFEDSEHTRFSNEFSNVGSRDWMPLWAQGIRVDSVSPCFDVFALGKIIWSMISGRPKLQGWYFDNDRHPDNNLENIFSEKQYEMKLINNLFSTCLVEHEDECLENANLLLEKINELILQLESNSSVANGELQKRCICCPRGFYKIHKENDEYAVKNFGLSPRGNELKIYLCDHCGHAQLFCFENSQTPNIWKKH